MFSDILDPIEAWLKDLIPELPTCCSVPIPKPNPFTPFHLTALWKLPSWSLKWPFGLGDIGFPCLGKLQLLGGTFQGGDDENHQQGLDLRCFLDKIPGLGLDLGLPGLTKIPGIGFKLGQLTGKQLQELANPGGYCPHSDGGGYCPGRGFPTFRTKHMISNIPYLPGVNVPEGTLTVPNIDVPTIGPLRKKLKNLPGLHLVGIGCLMAPPMLPPPSPPPPPPSSPPPSPPPPADEPKPYRLRQYDGSSGASYTDVDLTWMGQKHHHGLSGLVRKTSWGDLIQLKWQTNGNNIGSPKHNIQLILHDKHNNKKHVIWQQALTREDGQEFLCTSWATFRIYPDGNLAAKYATC